jgi:hypothetical protein
MDKYDLLSSEKLWATPSNDRIPSARASDPSSSVVCSG